MENAFAPMELLEGRRLLSSSAAEPCSADEAWLPVTVVPEATLLYANAQGQLRGSNSSGDRPIQKFKHGTITEIAANHFGAWLIVRREVPVAGSPTPRLRWQLWRSDGTREGTTRMNTFNRFAGMLMPVEQHVQFVVGDGVRFHRWTSDGTPQGTATTRERVKPAATLGSTHYIINHNEVWKTDGTSASTILAARFDIHSNESVHSIVPTDRGLFAFLRTVGKKHRPDMVGFSLFGTANGSCEATPLSPRFAGVSDIQLDEDGTLTFVGHAFYDSSRTNVSDGTPEGTRAA
jgi:hypothetical protein